MGECVVLQRIPKADVRCDCGHWIGSHYNMVHECVVCGCRGFKRA